jgi:hypothetical protein
MNAACAFCGHPVDSPAFRRCTFAICNHSPAFTAEAAISTGLTPFPGREGEAIASQSRLVSPDLSEGHGG